MTTLPADAATLGSRRLQIPVPSTLPIIVTLDGPAGTGKSSVARDLARRLGLEFLDTGAMYRAATVVALTKSVDVADALAIIREVRSADLRFDWSQDPPAIIAQGWGGSDLSERIRDADVTRHVSAVSAVAALRQLMVDTQRQIAREHPRLVSEGRDQGSVVFPDAHVKFYLDATPDARALRRCRQLQAKHQPADFQLVRKEIMDRDYKDSHREVGPLTRPADAVYIDTSDLTQDQVVDALEELVRQRITARL